MSVRSFSENLDRRFFVVADFDFADRNEKTVDRRFRLLVDRRFDRFDRRFRDDRDVRRAVRVRRIRNAAVVNAGIRQVKVEANRLAVLVFIVVVQVAVVDERARYMPANPSAVDGRVVRVERRRRKVARPNRFRTVAVFEDLTVFEEARLQRFIRQILRSDLRVEREAGGGRGALALCCRVLTMTNL